MEENQKIDKEVKEPIPEQKKYLSDKKDVLDSLEAAKKVVELAPQLKEEQRKTLLAEMEKLKQNINVSENRGDLPDDLYAGLSTEIQNVIFPMNPLKIIHRDEIVGRFDGYKNDQLFICLAHLNRSIEELHKNDSSAKECNKIFMFKFNDVLRVAKNDIENNPYDEANKQCKSFFNFIIMDMKTYLIQNLETEESINQANTLCEAVDKHVKRLECPDRISYGKVYFGGMKLASEDIDALSGTGSTEYTRLADAMKIYKDAPTSNVKELYEAARDYLKLKKTTPIFPEGKRRVNAAVKVMAQAAVQLMESGFFGPKNQSEKKDYLDEMIKDLKVECTRNSNFRKIMVNECPHLIEGGERQMYNVMHLAVSCERECMGRDAYVEGPAATASVIDGVFTVQNNACFAESEKLVNSVDVIITEKGIAKLDPTSERTRKAVDNLTVSMKDVLSPLKKQAVLNVQTQNNDPQIGAIN